MSMQNEVLKGVQKDNEIQFSLADTSSSMSLIPAGKMITDSKKMTFVYLIDNEDTYGHVHFKQEFWPLMLSAIKLNKDPVILINDEKIQLTQFIDELKMLIVNIEGNHNYGEHFSLAVEEAFAEVLKE